VNCSLSEDISGSEEFDVFEYCEIYYLVKKSISLQAWRGIESSRNLRILDYKKIGT
jgi:hypothetical protein